MYEYLDGLMESNLEHIQDFLERKNILKRNLKEKYNKEEIILLLKKTLVYIDTTSDGFSKFYYGFLTIQEKGMLKRLIVKKE